jgi:hypothetical protein
MRAQPRLGAHPSAVRSAHRTRIAEILGQRLIEMERRLSDTKVPGDFADRGLIRLGRGRLTVPNMAGLGAEASDQTTPHPPRGGPDLHNEQPVDRAISSSQ